MIVLFICMYSSLVAFGESGSNDDKPTVEEVRSTVNSMRGSAKSVRHCSYQVWLNIFSMLDSDEIDERWRAGLSHFCIDNFSIRYLREHKKSLP